MATPAKIVDFNVPTVALVGRVNVGKSTLFNRIIERQLALVSKIPGTTRTRNIALAAWRGKKFRLIDTGGLASSAALPLTEDIKKQTEIAVQEADIVVFVTDIQAEVLPQELTLARKLMKLKTKPIVLVANKADSMSLYPRVHDAAWLRLGLGPAIPVSAANGGNVGDLLDSIYARLKKLKLRPKPVALANPIRVEIGRAHV